VVLNRPVFHIILKKKFTTVAEQRKIDVLNLKFLCFPVVVFLSGAKIMKKIILFVLLLLGAAGATYYFTRPSASLSTDYYAEYLPQNTLATVSLIDLKGISERFPASAPGRFFAKPAMHGMLNELGVPSEGLQEYDEIYDGIADVLTNPAFRQVFGDDAVVALLPPDIALMQQSPDQAFKQALLVFGTSSVAGPLESFSRLVMSTNVSKVQVKGVDVSRIELDDDEVIYGYANNGVLMLAYTGENIPAAIQQQKKGSGLKDSPFFAQARRYWAESESATVYSRNYVNMNAVRSLLAATDDKQAQEIAGYLQGITTVSSVADEQDALRLATRVDYDFADLHPWIQDQYQAVSAKNISLGLLNGKVLIYYWVSLLHKDYLRKVLSVTSEEQYKQIDSQVQQELGVSLDNILAAVGPQLGLIINDVVDTGLFPLPKVIGYIQVRDTALATKLVDTLRKRLAEQGFAKEQREEVDGKTIYYWSILPGDATQLALVQTDNMIYVANGKASLKPLLAPGYKSAELPKGMADILGGELAGEITRSNYSSVVIRPVLLATQVREGANWLAGILEATQGKTADNLRKEVFALLESLEVVVGTGSVQKDFASSSLVFKPVPVKNRNNE